MSGGVAGGATLPPDPDAILTAAEVAAWLKITPRQVQRVGIPCVRVGLRTPRYLGRDLLAWLETQRRVQSSAGRRRARRDSQGTSSAEGLSLADVGGIG
jgi:hypothetical protein